MGENSEIAWTHHTFNPWRGCARVSPGCIHCYAETLSKRNPKTLGTWGVNGTRVVASSSMWQQPVKWDTAAKLAGERHRVFCASLADVGEDRPDLVEPRKRLSDLIFRTPNLDWLLLTKRPENMARLFDADILKRCWVGATAEDQQRLDERAAHLQRIDAAVLFLSCEPLLAHLNFRGYLNPGWVCPQCERYQSVTKRACGQCGRENEWHGRIRGIDWLIFGGESGGKRRDPGVDALVDGAQQAVAAGKPVFMKQDVAFHPGQQGRIPDDIWALKQFPKVLA